MRPASEVNTALQICESELSRQPDSINLRIAHDVLSWVMGGEAPNDGPTLWLIAFLLDDPPKLDNSPPDIN